MRGQPLRSTKFGMRDPVQQCPHFLEQRTCALCAHLEERKKRGTLNMNIRQFAKAPEGYDASEHGGKPAYEGPTKNGMLVQVESLQQVEELQKAFNSYFEEVKKYLEED
jgi:hypothetical protein